MQEGKRRRIDSTKVPTALAFAHSLEFPGSILHKGSGCPGGFAVTDMVDEVANQEVRQGNALLDGTGRRELLFVVGDRSTGSIIRMRQHLKPNWQQSTRVAHPHGCAIFHVS